MPCLAKPMLDLHGLFSLPGSAVLIIALIYFRHPGNLGTHPFVTEVTIYPLLVIFFHYSKEDLSLYAKKRFGHKLTNSAGVFFLWYHDSLCYFPTVWDDTSLHMTLRGFHSRHKSFGHFLYSLYGIPLGPGADRGLAFLTTSSTSFHVGSLLSSSAADGSTCGTFEHSPNGSSLWGSEWLCFKCSFISSP